MTNYIERIITAHPLYGKTTKFVNSILYMKAYDGILLGTDRLNTSMNDVAMKDSEKMFDTALIFGQEPDVMRGKFDNLQAFLGDLCEFNIWSYVLTTSNIQDMASCKSLMKGDILSWDKASWTTKNVQIQDISDPSGLCSIKSRYFVISLLYDH